jgi:hypothetical protein
VAGHRLQTTLLRAVSHNELERFLNEAIGEELYWKDFEEGLAEALQDRLPEDQADRAENLGRQYAAADRGAIEEVLNLFDGGVREVETILNQAKAEKAAQLARDYARKVPAAVKRVNKILASHARMMDGFAVDALVNNIGTSQIDCLTASERMGGRASIAEARRNASFREIDRHRQELGEALRRSLPTIEDGEFRVIEPTPVPEDSAA